VRDGRAQKCAKLCCLRRAWVLDFCPPQRRNLKRCLTVVDKAANSVCRGRMRGERDRAHHHRPRARARIRSKIILTTTRHWNGFWRKRDAKIRRPWCGKLATWWQVSYTRQKEPLGLGHAVLVAKDLVGDEPFAVLLGDVLIPGENPATKQLIQVYEATGVGAIAVEEVPKERTKFVRNRGWSSGATAAVWRKAVARTGLGGEAETGECAFEIWRLRDGTFCHRRFSIALSARSPAPEMRFS